MPMCSRARHPGTDARARQVSPAVRTRRRLGIHTCPLELQVAEVWTLSRLSEQ
jgi:hypothetical protein